MFWRKNMEEGEIIQYMPPQKEHIHTLDSAFPSDWRVIKRHVCGPGFFNPIPDHMLVRDLVCSDCKVKYIEEVKIPYSVLSYVRQFPKSAKELGLI